MDSYKFETNYHYLKSIYDFDSKSINKDDVDVVIYHNNCIDGFMCACIAKRYLGDVELIPFQYGWDPEGIYYKIKNKNVLVCDFSFDYDIFKTMEKLTKNILVLDHHKTAVTKMENIDDEHKVFDMDHCGAFITYCYFYDFDIPKCVLYVEDNDLWLKKLPMTREFTSVAFINVGNHEIFSDMFDDNKLKKFLDIGKGMVIMNDDYIKRALKNCVIKFLLIDKKYYFVGAVESNILKSDIGNKILTDSNYNLNFSMVFSHNYRDNDTYISLRSLDEKSDVSSIAKVFGGGGHRNASGLCFKYITSTIPTELDSNNLYKVLDNIVVRKYGEYNLCFINNSYLEGDLVKYLMQKRMDKKECDIITGKNINGCISYYQSNDKYYAKMKIDYVLYDKLKDYDEIKYDYSENIIEYNSKKSIFEFLDENEFNL